MAKKLLILMPIKKTTNGLSERAVILWLLILAMLNLNLGIRIKEESPYKPDLGLLPNYENRYLPVSPGVLVIPTSLNPGGG